MPFAMFIAYLNMHIYNVPSEKAVASVPIISWEIDGDTVETVSDFIFLGFKITEMVIAAMKLKEAYSLEGKLWPT